MDKRNGFSRHGSGLWRSLRDGDFEEEDVWAVLDDRKDRDSDFEEEDVSGVLDDSRVHYSSSKTGQNVESSFSVRRNLISAARAIPKSSNSGSSGISSRMVTPEESGMNRTRQSAPVNIPEWPNHCARKPENGVSDDDDDDDGEGDGYDKRAAPHEIVARRLARSQISSFSVCEGVGRTLKGRDLSKVRNAVLTKTGFLEQ